MSFFTRIFGGKTEKEIKSTATPASAIQRLRETEEMLLKKVDFLEKQHEEQMKIVKANASNKRVALSALKKAKRLEKQREQVESTLVTLESQREVLENASTNAEVLKMMKISADALKHAQDNMSLNKVEDLMDDVKEQQEIAEEIANAIKEATPFAASNQDEEDLLKELEELEQEELDKQLISPEPLPSVPKSEPKEPAAASASKPKKDEPEDELEQLKQWALS